MRAWAWAMVLAAGACRGDGDGAETDTDPTVAAGVTWHKDVRPVVESSCTSCHTSGGMAPFSMDAADVSFAGGPPVWASAAVSAVESGRMPPWMPSDDCHPIAGSRALSDGARALFTRWAAGGYAEGDPGDFVAPLAPDVPDLGAPDQSLDAGVDYTPSGARTDDYRCLVLGDRVDEDTFVSAIDIVPDASSVVHHGILYLVHPSRVGEVESLDADADGVGYPCFGGPLESDPDITGDTFENIATWVPGFVSEVLPDGQARLLPKGSRLVLQVHYNTLFVDAIPGDRTGVSLWTTDVEPSSLIQTIALPYYDLRVDAGDPDSVQQTTFAFKAEATVVGVMGHMHQLGKSFRIDVLRDGGATDCALDIPAWDFGWQQSYSFPEDEPFLLGADDVVQLTCVYDNSAENQVVVDGEQLEPREVTWGEGTLDEMCLGYAHVRYPYLGTCSGFEDCYTDTCAAGDETCIGTCLKDVIEDECTVCGLLALQQCATAVCASQASTLDGCLDDCTDDDLSCLVGECQEEVLDLFDCVDPFVRDGTCDDALASCGASL